MNVVLIQDTWDALNALKRCTDTCFPDSQIHMFSDSELALDYIESEQDEIDICFTGVSMRGISGLKIAEVLRKYKHPKVVFVSDTEEFALDAWNLGVSDYLLAPVTLENVQHAFVSCGY